MGRKAKEKARLKAERDALEQTVLPSLAQQVAAMKQAPREGEPLAQHWQCGSHTLDLSAPLVMGILNVTPDSFSDGGRYLKGERACEHAYEMIAQGARIIDVGGESTRPGATPVSLEEELSRVEPVVQALAAQGIIVSIDTRHPEVALLCVEAGASIINDVSGFRNPEMVAVARLCDAGLVVMHMQGEPETMQQAPCYDDVVTEVADYLLSQAHMLEEAGIAPERICVDPGPGFGKTAEQTLELLAATHRFASLGYPLMAAFSRKGFLGKVTGVEEPAQRRLSSVTAALLAAKRGARILRVHDVAETCKALDAAANALARQQAQQTQQLTTRQPAHRAAQQPAAQQPARQAAETQQAAETGQPKPSGEAACTQQMRRTFIGLGSNLGGSRDTLLDAMGAIALLNGVDFVAASALYESKPAYYLEQGNFVNAVVEIRTSRDPYDLLETLQGLELGFGRKRSFPNAPRTLDLDILDMEGTVSSDPVLTLPHPHICSRDFVVTPLLELVPDLVLADGTELTRSQVACGAIVGKTMLNDAVLISLAERAARLSYDDDAVEADIVTPITKALAEKMRHPRRSRRGTDGTEPAHRGETESASPARRGEAESDADYDDVEPAHQGGTEAAARDTAESANQDAARK